MACSSDHITILKALMLLCVAFPTATAARPMMAESAGQQAGAGGGGGSDYSECLETMFQLQSCTGEVILFFMNGETYLGPNCCRAIRTVEHKCWPSMFASVGFTAEESDILRGYCDAEEGGHGGSADEDDGDASLAFPSCPPLHDVNLTTSDEIESLSP
ncbi:hypothetical protein DM860_001443 [Cuscuta australis]|uniref:Prolamin-like domain-containing protein n=1 Tax=Cuscuta australis TaxID=267555 RepID=A0A328E8D7_9ASTE|nr:hypothetical protein DM860_001443 [Cuscuta australis]